MRKLLLLLLLAGCTTTPLPDYQGAASLHYTQPERPFQPPKPAIDFINKDGVRVTSEVPSSPHAPSCHCRGTI